MMEPDEILEWQVIDNDDAWENLCSTAYRERPSPNHTISIRWQIGVILSLCLLFLIPMSNAIGGDKVRLTKGVRVTATNGQLHLGTATAMQRASTLPMLINRARAGNLTAFEELIRRFQDMAVGYAYGILGNETLADMIAREAFVEAHGTMRELHDPADFAPWLQRIIRQKCEDITNSENPALVLLEIGHAQISQKPETMSRVTRDIHELPEAQRRIVALVYLSGYELRDVAVVLGLSPGQVNNQLYNTRKRFAEKMFTTLAETLHAQRPSRDEEFVERVMALIIATH